MYNPPAFREHDRDLQHRFMRERRFALLVSCAADGPVATSLPLLLETSVAPLGVLSGHVSKANAHWKTLDGADVLVVFQGPDAYVTPVWYPSKAEHGKVVPTWNYVMVQARGDARVIHDREWLHRHVTHLTRMNEQDRAGAMARERCANAVHRRAACRHRRARDHDSRNRRQVEGQPEPVRCRPPGRRPRPGRRGSSGDGRSRPRQGEVASTCDNRSLVT